MTDKYDMPISYVDAWRCYIIPTEIGIQLKSVDPFWMVVRLAEYPESDECPAHLAIINWMGGSWGYDLMDETVLYTHAQAQQVAEDLGDGCYALNLGDYFRESDLQLAALYKDYPQRRGGIKYATSRKTYEAFIAQGYRSAASDSKRTSNG